MQRGWGGGCGAQRGSCSTGTGSGGRAHERGVTLLGDDSAPWKQGRVMLRRNPRGEAGLSWLTGSVRCLNSQHPGLCWGVAETPGAACACAALTRLRLAGCAQEICRMGVPCLRVWGDLGCSPSLRIPPCPRGELSQQGRDAGRGGRGGRRLSACIPLSGTASSTCSDSSRAAWLGSAAWELRGAGAGSTLSSHLGVLTPPLTPRHRGAGEGCSEPFPPCTAQVSHLHGGDLQRSLPLSR